MAIKRTEGPGPRIPMPAADAPAPIPTRGAGRAEPELPPSSSTLRGRVSPLRDQIAVGLGQLAKAEGWQAQKNAMDVLVGTMSRPELASRSTASPRPDALSESSFVRLLVQSGAAGGRAHREGKQLARLALVALGTESLPGRPAERRAQLERDLSEIHSALSDVLSGQGSGARLQRLASDVTWVAQVLGRSEGAAEAGDRLHALAAMLKILVRYVPHEPPS